MIGFDPLTGTLERDRPADVNLGKFAFDVLSGAIRWALGLPFSPLELFASGEQGAWYDPSDITSMYQDAAGTTPAQLEQPVGLILDKRNPSITSTYFSGVTANITTPDSAALQFSSLIGTVECWVYLPSAVTNNFTGIIDKWAGGPSRGYMLDWGSATLSNLGKARLSVGSATPVTSLSTLAVGQWHHIAGVLDGTNATLYINGVSQGSVSIVGLDASSSGQAFSIGGDGVSTLTTTAQHISNVRVVKGTAVYTGNFTPPTAPLTAISGTSLLTCGTSWASNPTLTNNGAVASGFNPFGQSSNHASQTTLTARPVAKAAPSRLSFDLDPDILTAIFPSAPGNCTVAYGVSGGDPVITYPVNITGTTYQLRTTNTGAENTGTIIVNRALTSVESARLARWLRAKS